MNYQNISMNYQKHWHELPNTKQKHYQNYQNTQQKTLPNTKHETTKH